MENNNIVIVKHHPRPITLTNSFYTTQCPDIADMIVPILVGGVLWHKDGQ